MPGKPVIALVDYDVLNQVEKDEDLHVVNLIKKNK